MKKMIALVASLSTCACTTFREQAAVNPLTVIEAKADFCSDLTKKYSKNDPRISEIFEPICFGSSNSQASPKNYALNLMMVADMVCARELRSLSANQRTVNAALSTASTTFSAAAGVISGGLADDIVNGLATLSGSTRDHVNSEVYRNVQPELMTRLIQADRQKIASEIASSSAKTYSVERALYDANRYHQACSYYHGLSLLTDAANTKASDLEEKAAELEKKTEGNEPEIQEAGS